MARASTNRTVVVWLVVLGLLLATCIVSGMLIGGLLRRGTPSEPMELVNPADTLAYLQRTALMGWDDVALGMVTADPRLLQKLAVSDQQTRQSLYALLLANRVPVTPDLRERILQENDPALVADWLLLITRQLAVTADEVLNLCERVSDDPAKIARLIQGSDFEAPLLNARVLPSSTAADLLAAVAQLSDSEERPFLNTTLFDPAGRPLALPSEVDPFRWLYARRAQLRVTRQSKGWGFVLENGE